jgi:hypothetical protein
VTIRIEIDGNEVSLTGSRKGDGVFEALRGTAWKWSRPTGGFVLPRNLLPHTRERNVKAAKAKLEAAGFEVTIEDTGTKLSVAEEREQSEQRLTERAERYERTAERLGSEAESRWKAEHALLDPIPFGQPNINGRLTPLLKRAEQHRVAASKAGEEAERLAERAEGIRRTLQGTPQVTLLRRIERYETEIRDLNRRLEGKSVASGYGKPAEGAYRDRLLGLRARAQEALDLDIAERDRRAAEEGVRVWTKADFQKGDEVAFRYGWTKVLRVNAKSVTIPHIMDALAEHGHTWTLPYAEIKGRRRDGEETK